jgi:hypothetical protein
LNRGGCSYVQKVRNIEHVGGSLAIIQHTRINDVSEHTMNDDGSGGGIQIPSILIGRDAGDKILKYLTSTDPKISRDVALFSLFEMV